MKGERTHYVYGVATNKTIKKNANEAKLFDGEAYEQTYGMKQDLKQIKEEKKCKECKLVRKINKMKLEEYKEKGKKIEDIDLNEKC